MAKELTPEEIQKIVWLKDEVEAGNILVAELNDKCRKLEVQLAKSQEVCPECKGVGEKVMPCYDGKEDYTSKPCPTCQGKAHSPELRKELIDWVTAYKDAAERNALAECPDESADYLIALCQGKAQKAIPDRDKGLGDFTSFLSFKLGNYMGEGLFENYPDNFNQMIHQFAKELFDKIIDLMGEK